MTDESLITIGQAGVFVMVSYQGRRSRDLYLAIKDDPIHCCQCDEDLAEGDLLEHVWGHACKRLQAKRARMMEVPG